MRPVRSLILCLAVLLLPLRSGTAEDLTYCYLGWDAQGAGKNALAISHYNRCIDKGTLSSGQQAIAHFNRGNAYYSEEQYNQALADYNAALRIKPDYIKVYLNRGNAYARIGQYSRAIADYDHSLRLKPNDFGAYGSRATAHCHLGKAKQAFSDYMESARLEPSHANNLQFLLMLEGFYQPDGGFVADDIFEPKAQAALRAFIEAGCPQR